MTLIHNENYPPLNLKTDEEIIAYINEHQVAGLHTQGYEWFWAVYMPALERVVDADEVDHETIAGNFYAVGDVHDFNNSPRVAITYYKRALDFDPDLNAAHREIASMYHRMGFIDAAIHHSDMALALWPDEKYAAAERIDIDADKTDPEPYFEKPDRPAALALNALARQDPLEAIKLLEGLGDIESLQTLTWAHGANQDFPAYLSTWETLLEKTKNISIKEAKSPISESKIRFMWGDYFFMPDKIWYGPKIWKLMIDSGRVFVDVGVHEGLDDNNCDIATDDNFEELSYADQNAQKLEYYYYDRSNNLEGLKSIQIKYPNWKDLNASIAILEAK